MSGGGAATASRMPVLPAGRDECGDPDEFRCYGVYRRHLAGCPVGILPTSSRLQGGRDAPRTAPPRRGGVTACHDPLNVATPVRARHKEASEGRSGEDLYHRINAFPILLSPLGEDREDIYPPAFSAQRLESRHSFLKVSYIGGSCCMTSALTNG